jgi:hypothetical protein
MKRLIFPLLMMVCSVSWAKWELTGSNSYETVFFYHDRSTIQRNGSFVMMWSMVNFSSVTSDDWGNSSGVFYWKQSLRMATQVTHT